MGERRLRHEAYLDRNGGRGRPSKMRIREHREVKLPDRIEQEGMG